jgi:hypothetical protein
MAATRLQIIKKALVSLLKNGFAIGRKPDLKFVLFKLRD